MTLKKIVQRHRSISPAMIHTHTLSANGHSSRIKNVLSRIFRELHVLFRGTHVEQQLFLWRCVHHLPGCCWLGNFCAMLAGPLPSKCTLTFAHSFAKLSRKYPYSQTPWWLGAHQRKRNARGLGVWLSQSLTFGSLAAACGACFLRLQKATLGSTSGRCKDVLQDHGIWRRRSLTFGSLAATYAGKGKCAVPLFCRTPGRSWGAGGGSP